MTDQCLEGNSDGLCVKDGMHVDVRGIQLQQTLNLGDYSIKLITGTREQEEVLANTYTGEAFTSLFDASRNTTKESTQVELRVSSSYDGPFNFVAGANYSKEEVDTNFPGMIGAFKFGAPPHGGSAPGIDRIVMLLADEPNIREVIVFPMNQKAEDLLMNAPAPVTMKQLRELSIRVVADGESKGG